jgi:hypothetical protein
MPLVHAGWVKHRDNGQWRAQQRQVADSGWACVRGRADLKGRAQIGTGVAANGRHMGSLLGAGGARLLRQRVAAQIGGDTLTGDAREQRTTADCWAQRHAWIGSLYLSVPRNIKVYSSITPN